MNLQELNQISLLETKPLIKVSDLPRNIPLPILSAKLVTTKFGETILIEFDDNKTFLPKRVAPLMKDNLAQFTDYKYSLIFVGLKDVKKPSMGITFQFVESK